MFYQIMSLIRFDGSVGRYILNYLPLILSVFIKEYSTLFQSNKKCQELAIDSLFNVVSLSTFTALSTFTYHTYHEQFFFPKY